MPFELHGGPNGVLCIRETVREKDLSTGVYRQRLRVVLLATLAIEFIEMLHKDVGHMGINRTLAAISRTVYCHRLPHLVDETLKKCQQCCGVDGE